MSVVHVPYGDEGVTVDASAEKPMEITALGHDVHLTSTPRPGALAVTEGLGAGQSRFVALPTNVRTLDGGPTKVRVKRVRGGRSHDYPEAA